MTVSQARRRSVLVLLVAVSAAAFAAGSAPRAAAADPDRHSLSTVLDALSRASGRPIVASADLLEDRTAAMPEPALGFEAGLRRVLAANGLEYTALETGVVVIRPASGPAPASPPAPAGVDPPADTVLVTGRYSGSLASARRIKRQAINLIDVIDARDIGDYPARNIAESMLRVPGVSIVRDRGEGLFVSVRGLAPNFQVVTLDGRPLAVNENVRDSGQDGRQFRFDVLAPEIVSGVSVAKTPLPDQEEGAMGAVITINTYDPLSLPARTLRASAAMSRAELAEAISPRVSGLASWRDAAATRGVLLAASYSEREGRQDRITGVGYDRVSRDGSDLLAMTSARPTLEQEGRRRLTLNAKARWRPQDDQWLALSAFHTRLDADYRELTYSAGLTDSAVFEILGRDGDVVTALQGPGGSQIGYETSSLRHDNSVLAVEGMRRFGAWEIGAEVYGTRAVSDTDSPIRRTRLLGDVGQVRLGLPEPGATLPDIVLPDTDLTDPGALPFRRIEWRRQRSVDDEVSAGLDARRDVFRGVLDDVSAGVSWRSRARSYTRRDVLLTDLAGARFDEAFFKPFPVSGFLSAPGALSRRWLQPDADAFFALADTRAIDNQPSPEDLRNSYRIEEDIAAAYAMATLSARPAGRPVRATLGVRATGTEQVSSGFAEERGEARPVSTATRYGDVLPSLNMVVEGSDRLLLRAAAAKIITRPSLADLAPRLTLNSSGTIFEARGGNPSLERYQGWQYDLAAEYYRPAGLVSVGLFYKDIDQFVFDQVTPLELDGIVYDLTGPANGGEAAVYGAEIAVQADFDGLPAPFDGFGVHANYTYTRSQAHYTDTLTDALPDVAPASFHLTAYYEAERFEGRLAYSWRDSLIAAVGPDTELTANRDAFGSLDASMSLRPRPGVEVQLEATNLLEAVQTQFVADGRFSDYSDFGRTVSLVVRGTF